MGTQQTPRNANEAIAQANRFDRAKQLLTDGYTFHKDADSEVVAVVKPGTTAAAYWLNMITDGCDCPDFLKNNQPCKHMMAWQILQEREQAERADDAAMWESICADHDKRQADDLQLPELPQPKTPLVQMLEALQVRIVQDYNIAVAANAKRGVIRCEATIIGLMKRERDFKGALNVVNEYWNKEMCDRLDLQPAPDTWEGFDSGYECGKDLADDRI